MIISILKVGILIQLMSIGVKSWYSIANEEVIGGLSERGGFPVTKKPMRQWVMRITEYADRLLDDLDDLDWPESIKSSQRNWIGKSYGAEISFYC